LSWIATLDGTIERTIRCAILRESGRADQLKLIIDYSYLKSKQLSIQISILYLIGDIGGRCGRIESQTVLGRIDMSIDQQAIVHDMQQKVYLGQEDIASLLTGNIDEL
jgi:hypothetical protein